MLARYVQRLLEHDDEQLSKRRLADHLQRAAEEIIEEARKGRMFILVDDEDRENEGDLVIPAQLATPEAINFMAKHARGLICLALTRERVEQLGLPLMAQNNGTRHQTAFTVSIEAREGVTTGISAADRARTVSVAIDPSAGRRTSSRPATSSRWSPATAARWCAPATPRPRSTWRGSPGLKPAGVICEIMNDDGTMARLPTWSASPSATTSRSAPSPT